MLGIAKEWWSRVMMPWKWRYLVLSPNQLQNLHFVLCTSITFSGIHSPRETLKVQIDQEWQNKDKGDSKTNSSWTMVRANVPRITSVELEAQFAQLLRNQLQVIDGNLPSSTQSSIIYCKYSTANLELSFIHILWVARQNNKEPRGAPCWTPSEDFSVSLPQISDEAT